jgi:hypothetical protein
MSIKKPVQFLSLLFVLSIFTFSIVGANSTVSPSKHGDGDIPQPQQSTTGPTPPPEVALRDSLKPAEDGRYANSEVVISTVPAYAWRHGCGPTAVGMVVGYYDGLAFPDLVSGDAGTQTDAVDQMIASGGDFGDPNTPGSEKHYEDYAMPEDYYPNMMEDAVITAGRTPHADDSLADYMHTSKSSYNNYYGWSWSNHIGPAFESYVQQQNPAYQTAVRSYYMGSSLTWEVLQNEIDAGRPMIFLVDTNGDGSTDHFVTVVGYRDSPARQYASWDTWGTTNVRWENFELISSGVYWGVWGGWTLVVQEDTLDTFEPDANHLEANRLEKAVPQDHSIRPVGDEDWVKFSLSAPSGVILETTGSGSDDTRLWLYDENLTEVEFNDNNGTDSHALIDRVCGGDALPAGTYYARVDEAGGDDEILAYSLSLSTQICLAVDGFEPDGEAGQATLIGSMEAQTHSIYPAGDADWVRFEIPEHSEVYLSTYGPEDDDTLMALYDSGLNELEVNDNTAWSQFAFIDRLCASDPLPPGTYFARVTAAQVDAPIASYDVSLYFSACHFPVLYFPLIFNAGP